MIKALLVDLDNTLIEDKEVKPHLVKFLSDILKIESPKAEEILNSFFKKQVDEVFYINSSSKVAVWKKVLTEAGVKFTPLLLSEINTTFWAIVSKNIKAFPGVVETLKDLKNKGIYICIVCGGDFITRFLELKSTQILPYIDNLVVSEEYGKRKADGGLYMIAKDQSAFTINECLVVGDDENTDILNPKKDGFATVKVGLMQEQTAADYHIEGFSLLLKVIESIK